MFLSKKLLFLPVLALSLTAGSSFAFHKISPYGELINPEIIATPAPVFVNQPLVPQSWGEKLASDIRDISYKTTPWVSLSLGIIKGIQSAHRYESNSLISSIAMGTVQGLFTAGYISLISTVSTIILSEVADSL